MEIHKDPKCREAYESWIERAQETVECEIDCEISGTPEMTPIEQMVFFRLKKSQDAFTVRTQVRIGKYRADFLLKCLFGEKFSYIVIECDGHDFHERTKEQAQKDKKRDRWMQKEGYKVYRFTGSEIWKSGGVCVIDALGVSE